MHEVPTFGTHGGGMGPLGGAAPRPPAHDVPMNRLQKCGGGAATLGWGNGELKSRNPAHGNEGMRKVPTLTQLLPHDPWGGPLSPTFEKPLTRHQSFVCEKVGAAPPYLIIIMMYSCWGCNQA